MLLWSWIPYLTADALSLSGIVSLLFAGAIMSHYTYYNLSKHSQSFTRQLFKMLGYTSETLVFAYLGLAIATVDFKYDASLILWSLLLCLVGRFLNIYPLGALANYFRKTIKISWKNKFLMWWSGLRGAVAFALALNTMSPAVANFMPNGELIVSTTLIVVLVTVAVFGNLAFYVVKCIGVQNETQSTSLANHDLRSHHIRAKGKGRLFVWFSRIDKIYLKPWLVCPEGQKVSASEINTGPEGDLIALSTVRLEQPDPNATVADVFPLTWSAETEHREVVIDASPAYVDDGDGDGEPLNPNTPTTTQA